MHDPTPLVDTLLVALIHSESRAEADPHKRFHQAISRVEELLRSTGFSLTANAVQELRSVCRPMAVLPAVESAAATEPAAKTKRPKQQPLPVE